MGMKDERLTKECTHLLVDSGPVTKDRISTNETRNKCVCATFLAPVYPALDEDERLVQSHEFGQIERVSLSCTQDTNETSLPTSNQQFISQSFNNISNSHVLSSTKKDSHYQGVRETDLGTVYKAIARAFEDSKIIVVGWVCQNALHSIHRWRIENNRCCVCGRRETTTVRGKTVGRENRRKPGMKEPASSIHNHMVQVHGDWTPHLP
jgi:hypothetical protein